MLFLKIRKRIGNSLYIPPFPPPLNHLYNNGKSSSMKTS